MFAIFSDLVLDLLSDVLIPLHFLRACLLEIVDLLGDLLHALLEVFGQIGALLPFFIKHLLVLQVQVMILLKNRRAEHLQCLALFNRTLKVLLDEVTLLLLLVSILSRLAMALQRLSKRVLHDFVDFFSECLDSFLVFAQAGPPIVSVVPLVGLFAHLFLHLLQLAYLESVFKLALFF